jgi:hypothetical protein
MSNLSIAIVFFLLGSIPAGSARAQLTTVAEQYLLAAVNQERASHGIAPVMMNVALCHTAEAHAIQMAQHGAISHKFANEPELSTRGYVAGAHFDRITENVAEGPTAVILHDAWMHSAGHRENILDPLVDSVGIAVIQRNGQLYAVEDFQRTVRTLTLDQQEVTVAVLLDSAGLELTPDANARRTCEMGSGYAEEEPPSFVIRYTTGDLSRLPSELRERLSHDHERRASVGACSSNAATTFSTYSIAIVLYP